MFDFKSIDALIVSAGKLVKQHAPEIMTGAGVILGCATVVLAVKETPKALSKIKEDSKKAHDGDENAYTKAEAVKSAWKYYVPAAITGTIGTALIIGAGMVNARRVASLGTAYVFTRDAYKEYREKVKDVVGEKKANDVDREIAKDHIRKFSKEDILMCPGTGDTIFLDLYSGRIFKSTMRRLMDVQNQLNNEMIHSGSVSLNDFYYLVGLRENKVGDRLGWHIDRNNVIGFIYDAELSGEIDDEGTRIPMVTLNFDTEPLVDFPTY